MDAHEVTCVCVCVCVREGMLSLCKRSRSFTQSVISGEWHCWDHCKGELGCKVLLNFSPN